MEDAAAINDRMKLLIGKYTSNTCSRVELEELLQLVKNSSDDQPLEDALRIFWEKIKLENRPEDVDWGTKMQTLLEDLKPEVPVVNLKRSSNWKKIAVAVAASVILLLSFGYWILQHRKSNVEMANNAIPAPQNNRAVISLANGKKVYLDKQKSGTIAREGNANVVKTVEGRIVYQAEKTATGAVLHNNLYNPRGSLVVDMTLSDGSRVWLNAGSSITFPVTFAGNERKVEVSGEAYFEVTNNAKMPFKVKKGNMEVTVLGTHFNVNAYDDEEAIKVTLLEGAVKTTIDGGPEAVLKPGEQAQIRYTIKVLKNVNLETEMAWKDGVFRFHDTNIEEIMRQAARWYDVEIVYEGNPANINFSGSVVRQADIGELLKRLEATGLVHFRMGGKKVIVIPG